MRHQQVLNQQVFFEHMTLLILFVLGNRVSIEGVMSQAGTSQKTRDVDPMLG